MKYYFDSYAIVEFFRGNPKYASLLNEQGVCTIFNAAEVYFVLKSQYSEEIALRALVLAYKNIVEVPLPVTVNAMHFRAEFNAKNKRNALSYADAIGYTYARENGLEFVTGDEAFKNLKDVLFLK